MIKLALLLTSFLLLGLNCSAPEVKSNSVGNSKKASTSPTPTDQETKENTEAEMLSGEDHHDGSLTLAYIGDIDSVPALLKVLQDNPPAPDGTMACTTEHAIEALKKITGADPGYTYKKWNAWWQRYQRDQVHSVKKRK